MTQLTWDVVGEKFYEAGTDRGVLYIDDMGYAWNGLISVDESPSGGDIEQYYLDGIPYISASNHEEFKAKIEAFTYPAAFAKCDGSEEIAQGLYISQQNRKPFHLTYRTLIGNDVQELEHGYKIHIVYNAMARPTGRSFSTISDSTDPSTFSWDISTRPEKFEDPAFGFRYGAHIVLDSREVYPWALTAIEEILYGTSTTDAYLPTPQELLTIFIENALLKITDNGDGTWTAEGPDSIIQMLTTETFEIDWPSVVSLGANVIQISSL